MDRGVLLSWRICNQNAALPAPGNNSTKHAACDLTQKKGTILKESYLKPAEQFSARSQHEGLAQFLKMLPGLLLAASYDILSPGHCLQGKTIDMVTWLLQSKQQNGQTHSHAPSCSLDVSSGFA